MKKLLFVILVVALGAGAAYLAREGMIPSLPGAGSDRAVLRKQSYRFLECLKFKDFKGAAAFHSPEDLKTNPNLPKLLEDFFLIPPESLDIQDIALDFIDFDSSGDRAKVKTTTTVNILNKKETQKPEIMLYWRRQGLKWYLDLRTTLERSKR